MKARYTAGARVEFLEAVAYHEQRRDRLGIDFAVEVRRAARAIIDHPLRWPKLTENERRYRLRRFTYGIVYRVDGTEVEIVAVMHLHRRPGYWRRRN